MLKTPVPVTASHVQKAKLNISLHCLNMCSVMQFYENVSFFSLCKVKQYICIMSLIVFVV